MLRPRRPPKKIEAWKGPKPKLPMQVTKTYRVHYLDLQLYLWTVYRLKDYDVLRASGITQGLFPEYWVSSKMPETRNLVQQVDNVRRGRRIRNIHLILCMLCLDGFIPSGLYVIDTRPPVDPYIEYSKMLENRQDPDHPECVDFKNLQGDVEFERKAANLDKHFRRMMES